MIVVADSTPLIALARIDRLNLLKELFGAVLIPEAVFQEVVTRGKERPGSEEVLKADWIKVKSPNDRAKVAFLLSDLDEGEAEALVLAEEVSATQHTTLSLDKLGNEPVSHHTHSIVSIFAFEKSA
jgi:predicted nucleic acid-binding protein